MSHIICMNSKEFMKKFIEAYDYKDFNFLLVSEDVKTNGKYKTAYSLRQLLPPPNIISEFVNNGYSDKYKKKYFEYLSMPKVEGLLSVAVKLAVVDKANVVFLCSKNESQYRYLDLIAKYLAKVYGVNVCSYKDFHENPDANTAVRDKKKTIRILGKKLSDAQVDVVEATSVNKKAVVKKLKGMSKKQLRAYCEANRIKVKKSDEKEDMIKRILKDLS